MGTPLVVHCHFYQPPRENPCTGIIDPEPDAAPFHDWNERVHAECYRPNAFARVLDDRGRIAAIVNNYAQMSFDVGPTLLSWLEQAHPDTYRRILEADGGHRAMAQAYNHSILPLCNERDRRTQIAWGKADFEHRFGREPAGMWLPETAADEDTLADLVDAGIRFTVLAPQQAARPEVDTKRPYLWQHPDRSGRSLALFFYDGQLARAVAFEKGISTSELFVERLVRSAAGGLVHLATDGETYGHHVRFGDRSLAFALTHLAPLAGFDVTSYQAYLESHPPSDPIEIVSRSSWSCAHGLGRWERDCGCSTGGEPGWSQSWRAPLRAALDILRDSATALYESKGSELFPDPWRTRDAYIDVLLRRISRREFCDAHAGRALSRAERVLALTLLEMQRHSMLMYTSCGWFFNDLAGIETTQVMRYAARVLSLMDAAGGEPPREDFDRALAEAKSNRPGAGDGARVFAEHVFPAQAPADRIVAHLALLFIADAPPADGRVGTWRVRQWAARRESHGRVTLATGHVEVESLTTAERLDCACVTIYLGGIDFWGSLVPFTSKEDLEAASAPLWDAFPRVSLPELLRVAREAFPGEEFGLEKALPYGRQTIIETVFADLVDRFALQYERLYDDHHRILELLRMAGYRMPAELTAAAGFTLSRRLDTEIEGHSLDRDALGRALEIAREARVHGWQLDTSRIATRLSAAVTGTVALALEAGTADAAAAATGLLDLALDLGVMLDLDAAQEMVYSQLDVARRRASLGELALRLGLRID